MYVNDQDCNRYSAYAWMQFKYSTGQTAPLHKHRGLAVLHPLTEAVHPVQRMDAFANRPLARPRWVHRIRG